MLLTDESTNLKSIDDDADTIDKGITLCNYRAGLYLLSICKKDCFPFSREQ